MNWEDFKILMGIICLFFGLILFALGMNYCHSYFEAKTYNKLTGKNVTTWDAMWVDLRINEQVK